MTTGLADPFSRVAERVRQGVVRVEGERGAGAGTAWEPGLVVTNRHVAPGDVAVVDGREARVVAADGDLDLALLAVPGLDAPPIPVRLDDPRPGELVLAVGHPWGQAGAVALGTVAGVARWGRRPLVRADIRLAPGNSGGPLVDSHGRMVGLNTMVAGDLGLAIPCRDVAAFVARARAGAA